MEYYLFYLTVVLASALAAPVNEAQPADKAVPLAAQDLAEKDDLNAAASNSYTRRFSDWGANPSGYGGYSGGVTGYGLLDNKYNNYNSYQGGVGGGYDNTFGYNGYSGGYPGSGFGGSGYSGYNKGYGYGTSGLGNGGYGGYGGNGGLTSYYGYNNPYNQGAYHLGYGYYNQRPGYGNIYNSGITPSLVTGYRGYTR